MSGGAAILIIDDDQLVRRSFRRVLERWAFHVIEAEDGPSGLIAAQEHAAAAVLLDLRMPGMDGLDVLSVLVQKSPDLPVVVVSGESTMTDVVEALRRGAWDFISKPVVDSELLIRTVARSLEKARLLRQNREYSDTLRQTNQRLSAALEELRADEQAARKLQFQLLPPDGLRLGPLTCFRRLYPSQLLSGDFVDYFSLRDGYVGFYLADVAGHGAASAFITAILTTLVEKYRDALASRNDDTLLDPGRFLDRLDSDLVALGLPKHVTMFYGVLDGRSGLISYANAGAFPFPVLGTETQTMELECTGRPLNLPGRAGFGVGSAVLPPGGRLLVVSDGVLELEPKRSHRETRDALLGMVRAADTIERVLSELGLEESTHLSDDVALLFVQREDRDV